MRGVWKMSRVDDERERHWRIVLEENDGGVDDAKELLNFNRWYVYVHDKKILFRVGIWMEVVCSKGKKVVWEMVDNHVVEEETENDDIGLQEFDFSLFGKDENGGS